VESMRFHYDLLACSSAFLGFDFTLERVVFYTPLLDSH